MKFHGIHQSQTTPGESSKATPSSAKGKTASPNMNSKKRKASQAAEPAPSDDDEEEVPNVKPEGSGSKIKAEKPNKKVKTEMVKEEAKSVKTEDADKKVRSSALFVCILAPFIMCFILNIGLIQFLPICTSVQTYARDSLFSLKDNPIGH